jgi:2,4-dienoyl-CoA reductase-like NADH-dependent reductase (Old Yellow Enzyme family)
VKESRAKPQRRRGAKKRLPILRASGALREVFSSQLMAKFFKYKSVADIVAESHRLGLDLRFVEEFAPLDDPVNVGPFTVGNRWCVQPMEGCDGTPEGAPDELTFRRYCRFGAGGAKLIWGEAAAVVDEGRANPRQLLVNESTLPGLAHMVAVCRQAHLQAFGDDSDLVIGLQLTHSGRYSCRSPMIACHDAALDPRTLGATAETPLVDDDYLARLVEHYVAAAKLAHEAGFQFVDVKQCHRYLLNELLGAHSRPGRYGGSYENRTRLGRDIVCAIRAKVSGLLLATRINVFDGAPHPYAGGPVIDGWGIDPDDPSRPDLTEPLRYTSELRQLGVTLVNVTLGNPYASPHLLRPFEHPPPDGYDSPDNPLGGVDRHFRLTAAVQAAFPDLPVVGSGYSYLQEFVPHAAAANIRDRRCTFAGVGRLSLAQPDFARQVRDHGRLDRRRVCRTFSYCTALMRSKHNELGQFPAGCPPFDKEGYGAVWQECVQLRPHNH